MTREQMVEKMAHILREAHDEAYREAVRSVASVMRQDLGDKVLSESLREAMLWRRRLDDDAATVDAERLVPLDVTG